MKKSSKITITGFLNFTQILTQLLTMKTPNQKQIDSFREEIRTAQLQEDIAYCIDDCNLGDEMIGNVLRSCEELGNISAEYLMEEFVFEGGDCEKYDDINYLNIAEFNSLYWEQ